MIASLIILGWIGDHQQKASPKYQMDIYTQQLKLKEKEQQTLKFTLESKRKLYEDSIQNLKQLDYKYNCLCSERLNYNLNHSEDNEDYINELKKLIYPINEPDDLINKIIFGGSGIKIENLCWFRMIDVKGIGLKAQRNWAKAQPN